MELLTHVVTLQLCRLVLKVSVLAQGVCVFFFFSHMLIYEFVWAELRMCFVFFFRFVATQESYAHPIYKRKLVEYEKTEYTDIFGRARWPGAPQRVLQTPFFDDWRSLSADESEVNQPIIGRSTIHGVVSFLFNKVSSMVLY